MVNNQFMDKILGMSESRKDMEDKVLELLELKDYMSSTEKERGIVRAISSFILGHDMKMIGLTAKETEEELLIEFDKLFTEHIRTEKRKQKIRESDHRLGLIRALSYARKVMRDKKKELLSGNKD